MRLNVLVLRTLSIRFNSLNAMNTFQQLCCLDSEDKTAPDRDTESDTKTVTLVQLVLRTSLYGLNYPVFGINYPVFRPNYPVFGKNYPVFGINYPVFRPNYPVFGKNYPVFHINYPGASRQTLRPVLLLKLLKRRGHEAKRSDQFFASAEWGP